MGVSVLPIQKMGVSVLPKDGCLGSPFHIKWRINQVPEGIGSPVIVDNRVYRLHSPNVLKCWDARDGKLVYAERLDRLSTTWASPVVDASGRLYFANAGVSYIVQSGADFQVLAINDLGDANHASAAVSGGKLFLVGTRNLYCVDGRHLER